MIRLDRLQIGDVVGTTNGYPLAAIIKAKTWGWRSMFDQKKCNHIATVVDRGHGLLYFAEMLSKGIALTSTKEYDHKAPRDHICFVGRHAAFDDIDLRVKYNNFILAEHARGVKYGWDDFLRVSGWFARRVKDNPSTYICNELPREGFKACAIWYPPVWDGAGFCPMDWQCWVNLNHITSEVVC